MNNWFSSIKYFLRKITGVIGLLTFDLTFSQKCFESQKSSSIFKRFSRKRANFGRSFENSYSIYIEHVWKKSLKTRNQEWKME